MNYQSLKVMIDNLVQTYKCPECSTQITDKNIDIIGAAGNSLNIDIFCEKCQKNSLIKSEILSFDLSKININKENVNQFKKGITSNTNRTQIKDKQIVDLNKIFKKDKFSVSDLLL